MTEFEKLLDSWIRSARSDLDTASLLVHEARLVEGLFFCHLAIEKGLKAHVIGTTRNDPPLTQDLRGMVSLAHITLGEKDCELLDVLMDCRRKIGYPFQDFEEISADRAFDHLDRSRELLKWLEITL